MEDGKLSHTVAFVAAPAAEPDSMDMGPAAQALCRAVIALAGSAHDDIDAASAQALADMAPFVDADVLYHYRLSPVGWLLVNAYPDARTAPAIRLTPIKKQGTRLSPSILLTHLQSLGMAATLVVETRDTDGAVTGALVLANPRDHWQAGVTQTAQLLADALQAASDRQQLERRQADRSAQQDAAVARMRATLAAMQELVLEFDEDGVCIDVHTANPKGLRGPPGALLNRSLEQTLPPEIAQIQRDALERALRDGSANVPLYRLEIDGQEHWFTLTVSRRARVDGRGGCVFVIRDVTDTHRQETENARFSHVLRRMSNAVATLDDQGLISWVNDAFARQAGRSAATLVATPYLDTTRADPESSVPAILEGALTQRRGAQFEVSKTTPTGQTMWASVNLQPVEGPTMDGVGWVAIETDITERRMNEIERHALSASARRAHERLQMAIAALPHGFAYFNAEQNLVLGNQRFHALVDRVRSCLVAPGPTHDWPWPDGAHDLTLGFGEWVRLVVSPTPDNGRVIMFLDISLEMSAKTQLEGLINGANIGTWNYDLNTADVDFNDQWYRILGFDVGDKALDSASKWLTRYHPEDRERVLGMLRTIRQGQRGDLSMELRLRHRDGSWRHVLLRGNVTRWNEGGQPVQVGGVGIDISERRLAEDRLSAILEAANVGTWAYRGSDGSVQIDKQYAALAGYSVEDLSPYTIEKFHTLVHPDDLPGLIAGTQAQYDAGSNAITHEYRIRHADGSWRWIASKAEIVDWATPQETAFEQGIVFDVTDRKRREAELAEAVRALQDARDTQRATEQRLADIASATDDWFWETDRDGIITYISSGIERTTGVPAQRLIGRSSDELLQRFTDFAGTPVFPRGIDVAARALNKRVLMIRSSRHTAPEGASVRLNGEIFTGPDDEPAGLRGVGSDVTAMVRAREQAEAANQAKSRFLANMSHELRTPLTAVLGMADMLARSSLSDEQQDMIGTIQSASEGLLAILNDILDLAKIEAGKMALEAVHFNPADILRRARALYHDLVVSKGIAFDVTIDPAADRGHLGDPNRLQQVLHNLVTNAIKFTHAGSIQLSLRADTTNPGGFSVQVSDSGIGMSPSHVAKVFEEFEQAETSTARRFGGTGLGLSISRHLVSLMNGKIDIASDLGHGTTVSISLALPLAQQTAAAAPTEETLVLDGVTLLVADDNATNRRILEALLGSMGARILLAEGGQQAVNLFDRNPVDALLLDISMPDVDGMQALSKIRHIEQATGRPRTPAYAVTANAMSHQVDEYLAHGFDGHVPKPFKKQDFARHLGTLVGRAP